jgi:subtilisin family serine protease
MKKTLRLLAVAALCMPPAFADSAAMHLERMEFRHEAVEASRYIVEFHGVPAALSGGSVRAAGYDELFARFRADLAPREIQTLATQRVAPSIVHEYRSVFLGAALEIDAAEIPRLRALPYVRAIHPDREVRVAPSPANMTTATVDARTKVNASGLATGGSGIVVAVLDTGIDYTHPALGGGYGPGFKVAGGYDFINDDDDPMDDNGHGTHVAGTVAANAAGLIGVAPDATLLAYKVLSAQGSGPTSGVIAAIERSVDPNGDGDPSDRVDVINLSLGGAGDAEDPGSRAVDNAVAAGVVVVAAAGNDGRVASIGSPGSALHAITVAAIDDDSNVTSFSSRGPAPRLLGFKPDISAPGYQVVSTKMGGGAVALNGTSMAAPHVAGVAALLRKLNPHWTPAEVKASITSSATVVAETPFARGAGRVNALAAHEATLLSDSSGLSFGIRASRVGSTSESRSFRLTNRSSSAQSLTIAPGTVPSGVTLRITPASVQIPPGGSTEISVELETANATFPFPESLIVGGDLRISGSSSMSVAWALVRSGRIRVTYDGMGVHLLALAPGLSRGAFFRDPHASEMFMPTGARWDLVVQGRDTDVSNGVLRVIVIPDVEIDGDHVFETRASDASLELIVDGRDENGTKLIDRSTGNEAVLHLVGSRFVWESGNNSFAGLLVESRDRLRHLMFSPLPERYALYHFEQFMDRENDQTYVIEHDVIQGLQETTRLESGGAGLMPVTLRWRQPASTPKALAACFTDALTVGGIFYFESCYSAGRPERTSFVHYTNTARSPLAFTGMVFQLGSLSTQAFRGGVNEVVVSSELRPPPTAERIAAGGSLMLGAGPAHPFAFPGTRTTSWFGYPWPTFRGAAGDNDREDNGTLWTAYDDTGKVIASGIWRGSQATEAVPLIGPQGRLVAVRDDLRISGRATRGTLDVRFGPGWPDSTGSSDFTAPTLTSLRVVDAAGATRDHFAAGDAAMLRFSVADVEYSKAGETRLTRPEATRAWYRISGTDVWHSVNVSLTGSQSGSIASLGHFPVGDIYRADLSSATAVNDRWIDLRLEFRDPANNVVQWTHESALTVGEPVLPPRRRSVGRN